METEQLNVRLSPGSIKRMRLDAVSFDIALSELTQRVVSDFLSKPAAERRRMAGRAPKPEPTPEATPHVHD